MYTKFDQVIFSNCVFDIMIDEKIEFHKDTSKNIQDVLNELKMFEINFDNAKDFESAGDFHKKRFELARNNHKTIKLEWWLLSFYKWSSSYGENYARSLKWIIIIILFFSFLYLFTGINYSGYNIWWWDYSKPKLFTDWGSSLLYSLINSSPVRRDSEVIKSLGGWTTGFSILETIIQTILGTLFIIGIRRKFKR